MASSVSKSRKIKPTEKFLFYHQLLNDLKKTIKETQKKATSARPNRFVLDKINFFTKASMVLMCTHLENYLKDILKMIIEEMNERLKENKVPHNLVNWSVLIDKFESKHIKYSEFYIDIDEEKINYSVSGDIDKTIKIFSKFGIDIGKDSNFEIQKSKIGTIVGKRNKIVHHNDDASDLSLLVIISNIDFIIEYMKNVDSVVLNHIKK